MGVHHRRLQSASGPANDDESDDIEDAIPETNDLETSVTYTLNTLDDVDLNSDGDSR